MLSSALMTPGPISGPAAPAGDDLASLARRIAAARPGAAAKEEALLCRALAPRIRLYGLKHLRDGALADDLVQQVIVTTLERLRSGEVREPERIASFALGTSRTIAIGLRRGERRRRDLLDRYAPTFATVAIEREPLDLLRLAECLDGLTGRDRAVVTMTFYAERSGEEIAGELALSPGNVRVVRHRALARLRRCMKNGRQGAPS